MRNKQVIEQLNNKAKQAAEHLHKEIKKDEEEYRNRFLDDMM